MEPSTERRAEHVKNETPATEVRASDADVVRLLHDALTRLGVAVRVEPLPEEAHLAGGYCVLHGAPAIFLSPTASLREQREALLEALCAVESEHVWLPPALRDLVEGR